MPEQDINYYKVLEISPDASFDDIQKSYLKLKNTYVSHNQALYGLMSPESVQMLVSQIEEAYEILSNPATRRKYDTSYQETYHPEFDSTASIVEEGQQDIRDWLPDPLSSTMTTPNAPAETLDEELVKIAKDEDLGDGNTYQKIRQSQNMTRLDVFNQTQISEHYLRCLEENDFDLLPQKVYVRGFLKGYLNFIGIPNLQDAIHSYMSRYQLWWNNKNALG